MCGINWSSDKLCVKTIAIGSNVVVVYVMMSTREIAKLKTCHSAKKWVQTLFEAAFGYFIQFVEIRAKVFWTKNLYSNFKNFEEFRTKKKWLFWWNSNLTLRREKNEQLPSSIWFSSFLYLFSLDFFGESFHCGRLQLNCLCVSLFELHIWILEQF